MSDNTENTLEFTMDDMYRAAVLPRVRVLTDIMAEIAPDSGAEQMLGANDLPYVGFNLDGYEISMSYYPVGDPGDGSYILLMRSVVKRFDDMAEGAMLRCAGFNFGSPFGFAIYDPADGTVELRAQIPETGGMQEREHYEHVVSLFMLGITELLDSLN